MRILGPRPANKAACLVLLAFALPQGACARDQEAGVGKKTDYVEPPRPAPEDLGYARNDDGTYTIAKHQTLELRWDPSKWSPYLAAGECVRWLMECRTPGERSLDDCFASAPRCPTDPRKNAPSETCCPSVCYEEYSEKRHAGADEEQAVTSIMPACFDRAWGTGEAKP